MGRNVVISLLLHAVIFVVAYVGLPIFSDVPDVVDVPISVEIVTVSDVTNVPTKPKEVKAKPAPTPPPKPPAPPPGPTGSAEQPSAPEPVPETPEEKVAVIVQPEAKPKKEAKPKPDPKDEPKKTETKKRSPAPVPPRKPEAPDQFASVLKTLEELKTAPAPKKKADEPAEPDFEKLMADALEAEKSRTDIGPEMTISEIDLVRQQIHRCWNLPSGAKNAHEMLISIRIAMNPDGTVRTARVLDSSRMNADPFYRTMAESALRAVLNPRCQPFKLPPEKYDRWQTMKLNFNPKEMFGL